MAERAKSGYWESVHDKDGGHYNNFGCHDKDGMDALRKFFPEGKASAMNLCLFSTSGVHGTYNTIEESEQAVNELEPGEDCKEMEDGEYLSREVTFLIVQPRICTVRHGNCNPQNTDDIAFLKQLRQSSWDEAAKIGMSDPS